MTGAFFQLSGALIVAFGIASCARPASTTPPPIAAIKPAPSAEPVYRFVSFGITSSVGQVALDRGRIGMITDGVPGRAIVNPDGSVELANGANPRLMGGVAVPSRLGGGFVFWDDTLYLARSFLAPLEPIVDLPTNAVGVEFGPDYLLLFAPGLAPRAFALDSLKPMQLSPKGVIDVVATDDGRALARDAVGRALASTDAGRSWNDVTPTLGVPVGAVRAEPNEVGFLSRKGGLWLQPDGKFIERASTKNTTAMPERRKIQLLRRVFNDGLALPGRRAWVGEGSGTTIVDLRTGEVPPANLVGPDHSSCMPLSVEEGLIACSTYSSPATTTIISHALSAVPVTEVRFGGAPQLLVGQELSVIASCSGNLEEGAACVRGNGGVWRDVKIPAGLLKAWQPLFWLTRESGGVAVVVGQRDVPGEPKIGLFDLPTMHLTMWDGAASQVTPNSSVARGDSSFTLLADGTVRGYTATGTITVDAKGHLTVGERKFATISNAGRHALARADDERLWQTDDFGAHWLEIVRPPFDAAPQGTAAKVNPRPSGRATRIDCSPSGCALEHPSGTGIWLRIGWPQDEPKPSSNPREPLVAAEVGRVLVRSPATPKPALPKLRCVQRVDRPLRLATLTREPPKTRPGERWVDVLGGQRALAQRGSKTFTNLAWHDVFGADQYVSFRLRAAAHVESNPSPNAGGKPHLDGQFVEPFDATARIRQLSSSTSTWAMVEPRPVSSEPRFSRGAAELDFDSSESFARPLLLSEAGHAGGVLLRSGSLSLLASNSGQMQATRAECAATSGYVDARGKRFVACAKRDASTRVETLTTPPTTLVHAPAAAYFRDTDAAGLHFFPPGESVFVNPDAIAVGRAGKVGILRLPPGAAAPTTDNPAWLLSADMAPLQLAPWSTLELATSAACKDGEGYRALVQTEKAWFDVLGGSPNVRDGMSALVRWSAQRVCLEAVEVGFNALERANSRALDVSIVARFIGSQPGAAFIAADPSGLARERATCELEETRPSP